MPDKYFYILKQNDLPNHLVIDVIDDLQMLDARLDGLSGVNNANKFYVFLGGPIRGEPYSYYRNMTSGGVE